MIYDMIWYDMIWYDMIWYDMMYDMIWYDVICNIDKFYPSTSSILVKEFPLLHFYPRKMLQNMFFFDFEINREIY